MTEREKEVQELIAAIRSLETKFQGMSSEMQILKSKLNTFLKSESEQEVAEKVKEHLKETPPKVKEETITRPPVQGIVRPGGVVTPITPAVKKDVVRAVNQPEQATGVDYFEKLMSWIKGKLSGITIEEFVGVNLLNKLGILILVTGLSFFLKLAYDWIGPATKIGGMFILSILSFAGGEFLYKKEKFKIFAMGIIAASFALLYFTGYASYNIEATRIIPEDSPFLGFLFLLILSTIIIGTSLKYKAQTLTAFAYFLGFLTLSINETGEFNFYSLWAIALLAGSLIFIITIQKWKYLSGFGIAATYGNFWLYAANLPRSEMGYVLKASDADPTNYFLRSVLFLLIYWIIFQISTYTIKVEEEKDRRIPVAINVVNAFSFFGMLTYIQPEPTEWGGFIVNAGMGTFYILSAVLSRKLNREYLWKTSIIIGVSLITLAIPSKLSAYAHAFGWLTEAVILIVIGFTLKEVYLRNLGYGVMLLKMGLFFTLPSDDLFYSSEDSSSLFIYDWNRGLMYTCMSAAFIGLILFMKREFKSWNRIDRIAYSALGLLCTFTFVMFSLYSVLTPYQSYLLVPFAAILLTIAKLQKNRNLYYTGISLIALSVVISIPFIFKQTHFMGEGYNLLGILLVVGSNLGVYFLSKYIALFYRYTHRNKKRRGFHFKNILFNGNLFLWTFAITSPALIFQNFHVFTYVLLLSIPIAVLYFTHKKFKQGLLQIKYLCTLGFCIGCYFYFEYMGLKENGGGTPDKWRVIWNNLTLWTASVLGVGICIRTGLHSFLKNKVTASLVIISSMLSAFMISNMFFTYPVILSVLIAYAITTALLAQRIHSKAISYISLGIQIFALYIGPLNAFLIQLHMYGNEDKIMYSLIAMSGMITTIIHFYQGGSIKFLYTSYFTSLIGLYFVSFAYITEEFIASMMAFIPLLNLIAFKYYPRKRFFKFTRLPFAISTISYFITIAALDSTLSGLPFYRKIFAGMLPLVLGMIALNQYEVIRKKIFITPSGRYGFYNVGVYTLCAFFVLFTTIVIKPDWWSPIWVVEGILLIVYGLYRRENILRYAGMALILISLFKLGYWDTSNLPDATRVLVFISIGLLFIGVSFLYAKYGERLFPSEPADTEEVKKDSV